MYVVTSTRSDRLEDRSHPEDSAFTNWDQGVPLRTVFATGLRENLIARRPDDERLFCDGS